MNITTTPQREILDALFGDLRPVHLLGGRLSVPVVERIRDLVSGCDDEILAEIVKALVAIEKDPRVPIGHRILIGGIFSRIAVAHGRGSVPVLTKEV